MSAVHPRESQWEVGLDYLVEMTRKWVGDRKRWRHFRADWVRSVPQCRRQLDSDALGNSRVSSKVDVESGVYPLPRELFLF